VASKTESAVINVAGMVQGIVLVTFPALSTIFTKASEYGLSSTQYGGLFLPQVVTAITASLLGSGLARRISTKRVYLIGLGCSTVAMGLLIASAGVKTDQSAAYPLLLVATAFLGAGFGLTVPVLNTYASVFHPDGVDRSVLVLNGVGPLQKAGLNLSAIFGFTAIVAGVMGLLSFVVAPARSRPAQLVTGETASPHPAGRMTAPDPNSAQ
jgi:MFS family permease